MAQYQLYGFGQSGNSYKAALMLALTGSDWECRSVDFFNGETLRKAYRKTVNSMGEVPVLVHGDTTLTQSGVILDYLAEETGRFGWETGTERRDILRWMLFDNHKFSAYYATLRFLIALQKTGETPVTTFLRGRARAAFDVVETHLASRDFLVGERATIADISLAGYVYFDEETGLDRTHWPAIGAWSRRLAALPGWRAPYDLLPRAPDRRS